MNFAAGQVRSGFHDVLVAGGVERVTRVPIWSAGSSITDTYFEHFEELTTQGEGAERITPNTFWPVTTIDTRATRSSGLGSEEDWRTPDVLADTVLELLRRDPDEFTGHSVYDEELLPRSASGTFRNVTSPPATRGRTPQDRSTPSSSATGERRERRCGLRGLRADRGGDLVRPDGPTLSDPVRSSRTPIPSTGHSRAIRW